MPPAASQTNQNKLDARQCLLAADKFIKEMQFAEAKLQIEKARSLDPSNIYISAFIDRITYFEQQKKSEQAGKQKASPPPVSPVTPKQTVAAPVKPPASTSAPVVKPAVMPQPPVAPKKPLSPVEQPAAPKQAEAKQPPFQPQPVAPPTVPPVVKPPDISEPPMNVVTAKHKEFHPTPAPPPSSEQKPASEGRLETQHPSYQNSAAPPSVRTRTDDTSITESQLEEMKKQIEHLSKALEQEKKAREEMNRNQVQQAIVQFRTALEKAWQDSAPTDAKATELRQLAAALSIPDNVVTTIQREVKIEMYGRAVKEVISKRQLLRSSSSTLEWLRKVYQISMEEYLEYESKFLLDLVADQYKGTIFQISSDDKTKSDTTPKLKALGYAVVTSPTPEDALEKIEKLNPNIILCETSFGPGTISGIRFLHILRTNSKFNFIPFIFLSNEEDYSLLTSSELRANEGYVKKPVNFDELSSLINTKLLWFREYIMTLSK